MEQFLVENLVRNNNITLFTVTVRAKSDTRNDNLRFLRFLNKRVAVERLDLFLHVGHVAQLVDFSTNSRVSGFSFPVPPGYISWCLWIKHRNLVVTPTCTVWQLSNNKQRRTINNVIIIILDCLTYGILSSYSQGSHLEWFSIHRLCL